jgi:SAM-dependent methyltransferase
MRSVLKVLNSLFLNPKRDYDLEEVEMHNLNKGLVKIEFFESGQIDYKRFIRPHVNIFPESKILDFGCGNGRLAPNFLPEHYLGVDPNKKLLGQAKINCPAYSFEPMEHLTRLERNQKFDIIFSIAALIHLESFRELDKTLALLSSLMANKASALLSFRPAPGGVRGIQIYSCTLGNDHYFSLVRRKFIVYPFVGKFNKFFGIFISPKKLLKYSDKNGLVVSNFFYLDKYIFFILNKR